MANTPDSNLPARVRESALVLALSRKIAALQPVHFDYWEQFNLLRKRVAADVGEISRLFPEFTPHDEELHLARLFGIADKLIGAERYERMNAAELFLLACGLYAHDWGMAVGTEELAFLQSGALEVPAGATFIPLDDETLRLRQFADKFGIPRSSPPLLDGALARLYIRRTHAWRSGTRARAFFHTAGSSIPQALELICQGHWLNFPELDDELRFSGQFSVLGYTVNLRAIALYVRLVDLFDIADDRTPYAVWRFVAPEDPASQMEWSKHRALSPVTFPAYGDGRCVRFDGRTADPEVWAELQDLGRYCEEQIHGTIDLLARHPDTRHQLDVRKLDWCIIADRFKPIDLRFEFHRGRMFEILANEIYQGDSHVFLRELLQNSIDAIATRRALVRQRAAATGSTRDVGLGFDDAIYFQVKHMSGGDAVVHCTDAGIGMDEYIVRSYLSVAGVSYYHSDDFKNLQLKLDPISTFGIGILSCFMVASRIEITTRRDPLIANTAEPIRLEIPAVERQFRVYAGDAGTAVGTTVTVHVQARQLKGDLTLEKPNGASSPRLRVTDYLAAIAGFVEFPIVVDEDGKRTVILHPDRPESDAAQFAQGSVQPAVRCLHSNYPWALAFASQDATKAAKQLQERTFNLRQIVGEGVEGWLCYVQTPKPEIEIKRGFDSREHDFDLLEISPPNGKPTQLRMRRFYSRVQPTGISPSSRQSSLLAVYRKGVLVADAKLTREESRFLMFSLGWPQAALIVNFAGSQGRLDVARRTLLGGAAWDEACWQGARRELCRTDIARALALPPAKRWAELAKSAIMFQLSEHDLAASIPLSQWPVPTLLTTGEITFMEYSFAPGSQVFEIPNGAEKGIAKQLGSRDISSEALDAKQYYAGWRGPDSVALAFGHVSHDLLETWSRFTQWRLRKLMAPVAIHFRSNGYPGLRPLEQTEFTCIAETEYDEVAVWERAMRDPSMLSLGERAFLRSIWWHQDLEPIAHAAPFAPPFQDFFQGRSCFNLAHPVGKALFQCAAALRYHTLQRNVASSALGGLQDLLRQAVGDSNYRATLWSEMATAQLIPRFEAPRTLTNEDFIPAPENYEMMDKALSPGSFKNGDKLLSVVPKFYRPFGQVLKSTKPEPTPEEIVKLVKSLKPKTYD